jgi:hypothetical protein
MVSFDGGRHPSCQTAVMHRKPRFLAMTLAFGMSAETAVALAGDEDCRRTDGCGRHGECVAVDGRCVAGSTLDCERSDACENNDRCFFDPDRLRCDDGTRRANPGMFAGGFTTVAVGGASVVVGLVLVVVTAAQDFARFHSVPGDDVKLEVGEAMIGAGAGLAILVGVPVTVAGGQRVQRQAKVAVDLGAGVVRLSVPF